MLISNLTFKNYLVQKKKQLKAQYPEADAESIQMTLDSNKNEWFVECMLQAQEEALRREVLDSMTEGQRYRIFHDNPSFMDKYVAKYGKVYINPEAR